MKNIVICLIFLSILSGCKSEKIEKAELSGTELVFTTENAKDNLDFTKQQYLKMIGNVNDSKHLHFAKNCHSDDATVCYPRAREHGNIFMEQPKQWTNGFYPGLFWKLLASDKDFDILTDEEEQTLFATALAYQYPLASEALRNSTHDLGFILYDSYGEALEYHGLSESDRKNFNEILDQGRDTLTTRYSPEHKVIKSWDFIATFRLLHKENGEVIDTSLPISAPWSYPVIVDNMMNLEFLLAGNSKDHHSIAYDHAITTMENHYFYEESDSDKQRPISYHLIDYDTMRPGNWQGMGSISAWARGQAWSFYGFVTVLEQLQNANLKDSELPDFEHHLARLFNSIDYLLEDDVVPMWDFFADKENAPKIANNMDPATTAYSRILDLCPSRIDPSILPYNGYSPISIEKTMVTEEALAMISSATPINGGSFINGDKISPCGSEEYTLSGRQIPKDTSAAAIFAAAMYRYAQFTQDKTIKQNMTTLADKIMLELTKKYRSDKDVSDKNQSFDLGFALTQATGNMPAASEINTSIVYADFYFVEANIRKLELHKND